MNTNGYFRVGIQGHLAPIQLIEIEESLHANMYLGIENGQLKAKVKGVWEKFCSLFDVSYGTVSYGAQKLLNRKLSHQTGPISVTLFKRRENEKILIETEKMERFSGIVRGIFRIKAPKALKLTPQQVQSLEKISGGTGYLTQDEAVIWGLLPLSLARIKIQEQQVTYEKLIQAFTKELGFEGDEDAYVMLEELIKKSMIKSIDPLRFLREIKQEYQKRKKEGETQEAAQEALCLAGVICSVRREILTVEQAVEQGFLSSEQAEAI